MSYELGFREEALREWKKLDANSRNQFSKKLAERLDNPKIPAAKLRRSIDRYKIKLRGVGYRLVYQVRDKEMLVLVIAIGRRDEVYDISERR